VALAILALLPVVTTAILYRHAAAIAPRAAAGAAAPSQGMALVARRAATSAASWLERWQTWTVPIWSLGVLLFSLRLVWGARQVHSLRRRGTLPDESMLATITGLAVRMRISRPVQVLVSTLAEAPAVVGWIRPVLLLPPATLLGLTPQQLEAVLAHELAHIQRHDYLINVLQMMVETLLFYHPAVWWTSAQIRRERELCCDDLAVGFCGDAMCYARALTTLERIRIAAPGMAMGSTGGPLRYRILRVVGARGAECGTSKLAGLVAICLGLACVALSTHWARAQQTNPPQGGAVTYAIMADAADREAEHGITVDTGGAVLHRATVEYPQTAFEKGVRGTVVVEATLDVAGNVDDAHMVSGPTELRRAAIQSVLSTHFVNSGAGSTRQVSITFATPPKGGEAELRSERGILVAHEQPEVAHQVVVVEVPDSGQGAPGELAPGTEPAEPPSLAGRSVAAVGVVGLPEPSRIELLSKLPVHEGDTLSESSFKLLSEAVYRFDEHLDISVSLEKGGKAQIRISAPGGAMPVVYVGPKK
jgi:TonB family protein